MHVNRKHIFHHLKGCGYNENCVLCLWLMTWLKIFLLLLLRALHLVIKCLFYIYYDGSDDIEFLELKYVHVLTV